MIERLGLRPNRPLEEDLVITSQAMSYGGGSTVTVPGGVPSASEAIATPAGGLTGETAPTPTEPTPPAVPAPVATTAPTTPAAAPTKPNGQPDFARMTPAQKLAYHRDRLNSMFRESGS